MSIQVKVPASWVKTEEKKTKEGKSFFIKGVKLGDKFIRFTHAADKALPEGDVEGNLYARKYSTAKGEFTELAIFVTNSVSIAEEAPAEESAEHVESGEEGLPF